MGSASGDDLKRFEVALRRGADAARSQTSAK